MQHFKNHKPNALVKKEKRKKFFSQHEKRLEASGSEETKEELDNLIVAAEISQRHCNDTVTNTNRLLFSIPPSVVTSFRVQN